MGVLEDGDVFGSQFEGCFLEFNAFAGGVREEEAEIDVDYVTVFVDHDVAVVAVLDVEDIADEGIRGKGLDEVEASSFIALRGLRAKVVEKVVLKTVHAIGELLLDAVNTHGVVDALHDTRVMVGGDDLVDLETQVDVADHEDLGDLVDELHSELLLAQVVVGLDDQFNEFPGLQGAEDRLLADAVGLLVEKLVEEEVGGFGPFGDTLFEFPVFKGAFSLVWGLVESFLEEFVHVRSLV